MAVNLPLQNFFTKTTGPSDWVRPVDWPSIVDTPNEVQFLMSDLADSNCGIVTSFSRTSGSQNLIIDWGDSTFDTITATTQTTTTHTYTSTQRTPKYHHNTLGDHDTPIHHHVTHQYITTIEGSQQTPIHQHIKHQSIRTITTIGYTDTIIQHLAPK
jgi:hypothetical protein